MAHIVPDPRVLSNRNRAIAVVVGLTLSLWALVIDAWMDGGIKNLDLQAFLIDLFLTTLGSSIILWAFNRRPSLSPIYDD